MNNVRQHGIDVAKIVQVLPCEIQLPFILLPHSTLLMVTDWTYQRQLIAYHVVFDIRVLYTFRAELSSINVMLTSEVA